MSIHTTGLTTGLVTTAAPTYVDGSSNAVSLDTAGALRVNVSSGGGSEVAQGSTTAGESGPLVQGAVTTAAPTYTTGKTNPLSLDTSGSLRVVTSGGSGLTDTQLRASAVPVSGTFYQATQPVSGTFYQATQPVSGTFWQATQPISGTVTASGPLTDTQLRAATVPVSGTVTANLGTTGTLVTDSNLDEKFGDLGQAVMTGSAPVVIASNQTAVPISAASLPLPTDAATQTTLALIKAKTDNLDVALSTRTKPADSQTVTGTVAVTNSGIPTALGQTTASASMPVVAPSNNPLPTSGGCSISRTLSVNNTTGVVVKNAAGQVYGVIATNTNAAARFVKLYNIATAPTVGTTVPVMTLVIPGNTVGAGMVVTLPSGIAFATGIGQGITTAIADNDTGAPAANEVVVHVLYA